MGSQLLLRGEGDAANQGGQHGDLYVFVHIRPHDTFKREGDDLICKVDVNFTQATLGDELKVPTLDGPASIKLPAGTQSGAVFRLKKKGMPDLHNGRRGDELVVINLRTPSELTSRQRELMEQLSKEGL